MASKPQSSHFTDDIEILFAKREALLAIEAIIFAAARPVTEPELSSFVPSGQTLSSIIAAIRAEITARPYDLDFIAGGWVFRTRQNVASAIRKHQGIERTPKINLSQQDMVIITAIAYAQPVTRAQICSQINKQISREALARLKRTGLLASGPRAPEPGAPITYITTSKFLEMFSLGSLADLPDPELRGPVSTDGLEFLTPKDEDEFDEPDVVAPDNDDD